MATMKTDVEREIVERLENSHNKNDIILDICESQGMEWGEVEAMVDAIYAQHSHEITLVQSPVLVILALGTFLGGVGVIAFAFFNIAAIWKIIYENQANFERLRFFSGIMYLGMNGIEYFGLVILGTAMIAGSLRGMQDVWAAIFAKLGLFQKTG